MEKGKTVTAASTAPPPPLLCLSLHETDMIRVLSLSATSIASLRAVIESYWKYGIQSEALYGIAHEFKLRGRPWNGAGEQANLARQLVAGIFRFLLQRGWVLALTTDLSKWKWDKDTFYFKQAAQPDPSVQVCSISFNESDLIRVIGGPENVALAVRSCIQRFWYRGMQRQCLYYGVPEFKLLGNPWSATGTETMQTRLFVGHLIDTLDRAGWEVYASIDISNGPLNKDSHFNDIDSWILRSKPPSLQLHAQGKN